MKFLIVNKYSVLASTESEAKTATPVAWISMSAQEAPSFSIANPGDVFSMLVFRITGTMTVNCGECGKRKKQMNQWGWLGCIKHRNQILRWIRDEARKRGHEVEQDSVAGLFTAAIKEFRSQLM